VIVSLSTSCINLTAAKANNEQGGYYFPGGLTEAEIAAPGYDVSVAGANDNAKFSVKNDLLNLVKDMRSRKDIALV